MQAMRQAAAGGMMRGPKGGMYRVVNGKKVYGEKNRADHVTEGLKHVLAGGEASGYVKKLRGFDTSHHYEASEKHRKASDKHAKGSKQRIAHHQLAEAHLDIARSRY